MTWSIIARDELTGQFGIAVATRFFAVGAARAAHRRRYRRYRDAGAVQSLLRIDGLKLLREGRQPREIVEALIAADAGRESRQLHIMDAGGLIGLAYRVRLRRLVRSRRGQGFSIAGNMLAGARVLDDTRRPTPLTKDGHSRSA